MNKKKPIVKILRSSKDEFLGAYPISKDAPAKLPDGESYLVNSVASAQDCTGIAVTAPLTDEAQQSLHELRNYPISERESDKN